MKTDGISLAHADRIPNSSPGHHALFSTVFTANYIRITYTQIKKKHADTDISIVQSHTPRIHIAHFTHGMAYNWTKVRCQSLPTASSSAEKFDVFHLAWMTFEPRLSPGVDDVRVESWADDGSHHGQVVRVDVQGRVAGVRAADEVQLVQLLQKLLPHTPAEEGRRKGAEAINM